MAEPTSYEVVSVPLTPSTTCRTIAVVRLQGVKHTGPLLVPAQARAALCDDISASSWDKAINAADGFKTKLHHQALVGALKRHGALNGGAFIRLVSLAALCKAAKACKINDDCVAQLRAAVEHGVPLTDAELAAAHPSPSSQKQKQQAASGGGGGGGDLVTDRGFVLRRLPTKLPPPVWSPALLDAAQFGLFSRAHNPAAIPLALPNTMGRLKKWLMEPIQLDRKGRPIEEGTWKTLFDSISLFLGFLVAAKLVPIAQVSLLAVLDPNLLAHYMAFMAARGRKGSYINSALDACKRVLKWLEATHPFLAGDLQAQQYVRMLTSWMSNMGKQLGAAAAAAVDKELAAKKPLPSLAQLILFQHGVLTRAMRLGAANPRLLHDALALSLSFGFTPPPRSTVIRTLLHPDFVGLVGCGDPDCKVPGCSGNRLEWTSPAKTALRLVMVHHKVDKFHKPVSMLLSPAVNAVAVLYIKSGAYSYISAGRKATAKGRLFITERSVDVYNKSAWLQWWYSLLRAEKAPFALFPLCRLRHIYATESQGWGSASTDMLAGAARLMLHKPTNWQTTYDLQQEERCTSAAITATLGYRQVVLQKFVEAAQQGVQQLAMLQQQGQQQEEEGDAIELYSSDEEEEEEEVD